MECEGVARSPYEMLSEEFVEELEIEFGIFESKMASSNAFTARLVFGARLWELKGLPANKPSGWIMRGKKGYVQLLSIIM